VPFGLRTAASFALSIADEWESYSVVSYGQRLILTPGEGSGASPARNPDWLGRAGCPHDVDHAFYSDCAARGSLHERALLLDQDRKHPQGGDLSREKSSFWRTSIRALPLQILRKPRFSSCRPRMPPDLHPDIADNRENLYLRELFFPSIDLLHNSRTLQQIRHSHDPQVQSQEVTAQTCQ